MNGMAVTVGLATFLMSAIGVLLFVLAGFWRDLRMSRRGPGKRLLNCGPVYSCVPVVNTREISRGITDRIR
jgi:hypothetical protein